MTRQSAENLFFTRLLQELLWGKSSWSEPMGGYDSAGNPITVSFGSGNAEGETRLGDGDCSGGMGIGGGLANGATHYSFFESANHDHYGSNNNGTNRGKYTGPGH